jgi:hypothetical protein
MTDFYYDGPIVLTARYEFGPRSAVWLKWKIGENDLASALVEVLGIDEESMAESGESVEVRAQVRVSFDPYRAKKQGGDT